MKKYHQNRGVPQNAYSLKLKSIKRTILHEIYSTKDPILGFFLLFNFQIDSALTFSSGLNTEILENTEIFLLKILENTEIFLLEILENTEIFLLGILENTKIFLLEILENTEI